MTIHNYIPADAANLCETPIESAAAADLINRIGPSQMPVSINAEDSYKRYGRLPGKRREKRKHIYDTIRNALSEQGVIETDGSYRPESLGQGPGKSKEYRLTEAWAAKPFVRIPGVEFRAGGRESALPVPPWFRYCLDCATFDLPAAHHYILTDAGVGAEEAASIVAACDFPRGASEGHDQIGQAVARVAPHLVTLVTQRTNHLWRWRVDGTLGEPTRDPSGHRLHTPISNLAHELRPFLGFAGNAGPMWEIDARNSQPAILASLAARELDTPDAHDLAAICKAGKFYEETFHAVHGRHPTPAERNSWKEEIFGKWLYSKLADMDGIVGKRLGARWPTVDGWIREYKRDHGTAALPCEMQKQEAALWIDALAPELEARGIRALTIHDAVLVSAGDKDAALDVLQRLYKAAGIEAELKCEPVETATPGALQAAFERNQRDRVRDDRKRRQAATIRANRKAEKAAKLQVEPAAAA